MSYRPLAGLNCFDKVQAIQAFYNVLPSPGGVKVFRVTFKLFRQNKTLPSPCGDIVFLDRETYEKIKHMVTVPWRG